MLKRELWLKVVTLCVNLMTFCLKHPLKERSHQSTIKNRQDDDMARLETEESFIEKIDKNLKSLIKNLNTHKELRDIVDLSIVTFYKKCYINLPFTEIYKINYRSISVNLLKDKSSTLEMSSVIKNVKEQLEYYKKSNVKCIRPILIVISHNSTERINEISNTILTQVNILRLNENLDFLSFSLKTEKEDIGYYKKTDNEDNLNLPHYPIKEIFIKETKVAFDWLTYEIKDLVNNNLLVDDEEKENSVTLESCLE